MRSLAVEITVFLLVLSAIMSPPLTVYPGSQFVWLGFAFAIIYAAIAFLCWKLKPGGFISAIIIAILVIASSVGYSGLQYAGDELLVMVQVLLVFFALRSYRELRQASSILK